MGRESAEADVRVNLEIGNEGSGRTVSWTCKREALRVNRWRSPPGQCTLARNAAATCAVGLREQEAWVYVASRWAAAQSSRSGLPGPPLAMGRAIGTCDV